MKINPIILRAIIIISILPVLSLTIINFLGPQLNIDPAPTGTQALFISIFTLLQIAIPILGIILIALKNKIGPIITIIFGVITAVRFGIFVPYLLGIKK